MSKIRFILCIFLLVVAFPLINLQAQNDSDWKKQLKEIRKNFGLVFQNFNLFPQYTALENVTLARELMAKGEKTGESLEDIRAEGRDLLTQMGLQDRMGNYPHQLSGGQQQRVAIARALANNPSVIIADDPTGNLDPARSLEIMSLLEKINDMGTTILVVTHERELVNRFGKRVVAIESGRIISDAAGGYYGNGR